MARTALGTFAAIETVRMIENVGHHPQYHPSNLGHHPQQHSANVVVVDSIILFLTV